MKNNNIILTTVVLSRNLDGEKFPHKLGSKEGKAITEKVFQVVKKQDGYSTFDFSSINQEVEVEYLAKNYITLPLVNNANFSGFALSKDSKTRIYVNADSHLEIVKVNDKLNLKADFDKVNALDDDFSLHLNYAFDKDLGYLASDMSILGTGLKIYIDMFLPAITNLNKTSAISNMLSKLGVSILDVSKNYGIEGVYRISNAITMGRKEDQIVSLMDSVTTKLMDIEKDAMTEYLKVHKLDDVKNMVYRAYSILKCSHMITKEELMVAVGRVKFGQNLGLISFDNEIDFSKLLVELNEDLLINKLKTAEDKALAIYRAQYLAKNIANIKREG